MVKVMAGRKTTALFTPQNQTLAPQVHRGVPSASDLAAATAALAAAVGNTVDLTTETPGPNPYQLAAMNASSGTPRGPTSKAESPNETKTKTPAKKQQGSKTASPEKRPKLAAPTPLPSGAPIPPPGTARAPCLWRQLWRAPYPRAPG